MIVYKETHFQRYVELNIVRKYKQTTSLSIVNNCQVGFRSFLYMRKGWYLCEMETMKIMDNE